MNFVEKLNALLKKKKLRGYQVAEQIGVTKTCVSRWRQGHSYPRSIELYRLAQLLGVTMEELIKEDA